MANEFKHKDPGSTLTQAEFIASDGTGHIFESQAAGDVLYASSTTVLARLAKATDGNVLELASGLPAWTASPTIGSTSWSNANHAHGATNSGGTLNTSALGAGTLAVDRGGTGATTLTDKAVLISQDSGTDTLGSVDLTTSGELVIGGSSGPVGATITAGTNITVSNGDGTIEIAAAGGPSQANQAALEAETNEDTYAPPDLIKHSPGVAKVWVHWEQTGAHGMLASYNMTSVTDGSTAGVTNHLFNVDFSGVSYAIAGMTEQGNFISFEPSSQTVTALDTYNFSHEAAQNDRETHLVCFGDQ